MMSLGLSYPEFAKSFAHSLGLTSWRISAMTEADRFDGSGGGFSQEVASLGEDPVNWVEPSPEISSKNG
jgi:hypothetical protein